MLLLLFVFDVQAAPTCGWCWLAAACYAAARSRGMAVLASRLTQPPKRCRAAVATCTLFLFVLFHFFVYRVASPPSFPSYFRRRRLQDLIYLTRKHTEIRKGRKFAFFSGSKVCLFSTLATNTIILHALHETKGCVLTRTHSRKNA